MRFLLAFSLSLLAAGQAFSASVHCTVIGSSLVKRMCEFDDCPSTGYAHAGQVLHAGCLADCSTEADPWVKLLDDTYVRATDATVTGCHSFSKPSSVKDLPRCHVQSKTAKPSSCDTLSASRLSNLSKEKLTPPPVKRSESAPANSTSPSNSTITRKPNFKLAKKQVNVLPKWYKKHAVRSSLFDTNVTVPTNETAVVNGTLADSGSKKFKPTLEVRAVAPNTTFPNGTFEIGNVTAGQGQRKPRAPRRMHVSLWV
ncbi:hypothetical protein QBC44DRAFT_22263 [Cladorrhinum sp. PSN332]|nr:hypothetical protein QBC44DRAFT_22263 [Cladorrhinum sp. PSN332]